MGLTSHLFRRGRASPIWYYRFTYPVDVRGNFQAHSNKVSLGTSDLAKARIKAAELLRNDLTMVAVVRSAKIDKAAGGNTGFKKETEEWVQEPGTTVDHDDGSWSYADENEITYWSLDRKKIKAKVNQRNGMVIISATYPRHYKKLLMEIETLAPSKPRQKKRKR